jgi:hypothetical protein
VDTNHLYWSAKTTHDENGEVIWAKFSSFLRGDYMAVSHALLNSVVDN